jgi:hypothetical protein
VVPGLAASRLPMMSSGGRLFCARNKVSVSTPSEQAVAVASPGERPLVTGPEAAC